MSYIATQVQSILEKLFPAVPNKRVFCEHYINYEKHKLFFDFYIRELGLLVEVQGRQHTNYTQHFHVTKEAFVAQKHRDNLKRIWAEENDLSLVRFNYDEEITEELVLKKISKALDGGFYE